MSQKSQVYQLQQLDSKNFEHKKRISEIESIINSDKSIQLAEKKLAAAESQFLKTEKELQSKALEVQKVRSKLISNETKLFSGNVKNPKELQDLQNEAESIKKHISLLEDEQLEIMMVHEENETNRNSAKENLNQVRSSFMEKQAGLLGEIATLEEKIKKVNFQRDVVVQSIPEDTLNTYEILLKEKSGIAIALIEDQSCMACGTQLSPSQMQIASSSAISLCPTCGRILFSG